MHRHGYTSYLRVYQPLSAFPAVERAEWAAYVERGELLPAALAVEREERRGLARALGLKVGPEREHALVVRRGDQVFLCPLRTELRLLQSMVAFRRSLPDEVAEAFIPGSEAERAVRSLETLSRRHPTSRSHIQQSSWHVPLHWFALFDDGERTFSPRAGKQPPRLSYLASTADAIGRLSRALGVLSELLDESGVVETAETLEEWLQSFDADSLVQLDYGGLASVVSEDELERDHSSRDVTEALEALEDGDLDRSSELYAELIERWSAIRALQTSN